MGLAADYLQQFYALLPRGQAISSDSDTTLHDLLLGICEEFARVDQRATVLIEEADPRTTTELLADWERVAGLPDECTELAQTVSDRRNIMVNKITAQGRQDAAYFVGVASNLGYTITVEDAMPYEAGHQFNGAEITASEWVFVWRVNSAATSIQTFKVGQNTVGDALRWWGNDLLECAIKRLKPAHTHVLFSYA